MAGGGVVLYINDEEDRKLHNFAIDNLTEGTEYRVTLVHEPTDGQIVERTLTA